jgi:hypothetical protein
MAIQTILYDNFNKLENYWDVSSLASSEIINGKLVTEGKVVTDTIDKYGAIYTLNEPISYDFEIETNLEWISRDADLGYLFLLLKYNNGYIYIGVRDAHATASAYIMCGNESESFYNRSIGYNSGSRLLKITKYNSIVYFYDGDILAYQLNNFNQNITDVVLTNSRFRWNGKDYPGKTAKWDYIKILANSKVKINSMNYNIIDV